MAEEFEVPSPHEHHLEHVTETAHEKGDNFAGKIAVMTAIMATMGALFSYQAGSTESEAAMNKNNAAIKKTEASNQWNYYQAKSSRQNLAELAATIPGVDKENTMRPRSATRKKRKISARSPKGWKHNPAPGMTNQN